MKLHKISRCSALILAGTVFITAALAVGAPSESTAASAPVSVSSADSTFALRSSEVKNGGALPAEYTGDGSGSTLPLEWSGAPAGTKSYALLMHHLDPKGVTKSYWILYNIPASVTSLPKNVKGIGALGASFKGIVGYEPPHSKGPGAKSYVLTLYALSAAPEVTLPAEKVTYDVILMAMKGKVLASTDLSVVYDRTGSIGEQGVSQQPVRPQGADDAPSPPPPPKAGSRSSESEAGTANRGGEPGGQRKPWVQMHGAELDANKDGIITIEELNVDANRAFDIYDRNKDGVISKEERDATGDVREGAAFAGFIYRHFSEIGASPDKVTRAEMLAAAKMIFDIADQNHDGKVTQAEWESSPPARLQNRQGSGPADRQLPPPRQGVAPNQPSNRPNPNQ